jgi:hypothetical protein
MKAAEISEIRAEVTLMHTLAIFYFDSNVWLLDLHKFIETECPTLTHKKLKKHCTTRWVEKQEAVYVFKELYPAVVASLENIVTWPGESAGKASLYLRALDGSFMIAIDVLHAVLEVSCVTSQPSYFIYITLDIFTFLDSDNQAIVSKT